MKKRLLFIDRDGTLIVEPEDEQIDALGKLEFYPGVFRYLGKICEETDYHLVMVSNQDGLGTPAYPEASFQRVQEKVIQAFSNEGIVFEKVHIDRSTADNPSPARKPGTAMLAEYMDGSADLENSYVIGDRLTDLELARNLGAKGIWVSDPQSQKVPADLAETCVLQTRSWAGIYNILKFPPRTAAVRRRTNETDISITLNLDGSGKGTIRTGIGFFDHMLEQVARHALCDLDIVAEGDLHVDAHHTIEDTALTLGEAFLKALGTKTGISRYGFFLPMDDAHARVAIDFGGRPWLQWEVTFHRESIGQFPTEMFKHFFRSFSDSAQCNIFIEAKGENAHHKAEAIFKAFARSLRMAKARDSAGILPTTKGLL